MALQGKHVFLKYKALILQCKQSGNSVMHTAYVQCVDGSTYLKLEVKTSTSPYSWVACSSERPTEARGGLLKTALAMASYSA